MGELRPARQRQANLEVTAGTSTQKLVWQGAHMRQNRSMPSCSVVPELGYSNVLTAIDWLSGAFGFDLRLQIADHRAQLNVGNGAVVVRELPSANAAAPSAPICSIMVRVDDVQHHYDRASRYGAEILSPPADYPFDERQYSCRDLGGHIWTFSQTTPMLSLKSGAASATGSRTASLALGSHQYRSSWLIAIYPRPWHKALA